MTDRNINPRIVFMGTPAFAATALQSLLDSGANIVACYSQPPRPKGRGQHLQKSPVHELAERHNIPVFTPTSLRKDEDTVRAFQNLKPDLAIVAAYGLILPLSVLNAPPMGCINIHASLLPRWRGASPIHHAIWKGDRETGITLMHMSEGLDEGDIIHMEELSITTQTTTSSLHDELAILGGRMIVNLVDQLKRGENLPRIPQDHTQSNYARLLKKEDGHIDWSCSADDIDRQVRALNPWPATVTNIGGRRLKIIKGSVVSLNAQNTNKIGQILNSSGDVLCGQNTCFRIEIVQPENSKVMNCADAINGGHLKVGDCFS